MRRGALLLALGAVGSGGPSSPAQELTRLRVDLRTMEVRLDEAAAKVSRVNAGFFLAGAASCRGYYLPGYGLVFILPPRDLPHGAPAVARGRPWPPQVGRPRPPGRAGMVVTVRGGGEASERELRALEEQVEAFQRESEQVRLAAEQALEEMSREMRARFALSPPPGSAPDAVIGPARTPSGPEASAGAPAPSTTDPPPSPAAPPPPPPVPWRFWLEDDGASDERSPDRLVADVREALLAALEAQGAGLSSLGPEDTLSVAVDFIVGAPFLQDARPAHSLVVRARKKDLDARQAGQLSGEELRQRIEVSEY
jgi:hypothetical protein